MAWGPLREGSKGSSPPQLLSRAPTGENHGIAFESTWQTATNELTVAYEFIIK